jgi:hypothetical protein
MANLVFQWSARTVRAVVAAAEPQALLDLAIALQVELVLGEASISEASSVPDLRMSLMVEMVYGVLIPEVSDVAVVAVAEAEPSQAAAPSKEACLALAHRVCSHF